MSLARLLQLASPALPVGAYSYSQGLEAAVEAGIVSDAASAERWIGDVLEFSAGSMEAALLWKMLQTGEVRELNELFLSSRESAELRAETVQMGRSLALLLKDLNVCEIDAGECAFPTAFAQAALHLEIGPREALVAYLWSWLENQVMAAIKAVPLGQTDGQRILFSLAAGLGKIADRVKNDGDRFNFAPGLAFLSARHETQYSRLFRS